MFILQKILIPILFFLMLSFVKAGTISLNARDFVPQKGKDYIDIIHKDHMIYLNPQRSADDTSVKLYKPVWIAQVDGKKFRKMKISSITTSPKRLKVTLTSMRMKDQQFKVLASQILPRGLDRTSLFLIKAKKRHRFKMSKFS